MKVECKKHDRAYEVSAGCPYCDDVPKENDRQTIPVSPPKVAKAFPGTLEELIELAIRDSSEAEAAMNRQFGNQWRLMDETQLGELLINYFAKRVVTDVDYADFATVTND